MKIGLTLGKFAPLHHGHQSIIDRGIRETDEFFVLIYDSPEVTAVPLSVRAKWIERLYRDVHVICGWDGPSDVGDTPAIIQLQNEYIQRVLGSHKVTHFYSSEFYGAHVSKALGAIDCRVDETRPCFPISGSAIRSNPFENRHYLDPIVYRDLITCVTFLGAPSTGKTSLCKALAERYNTQWLPEYGRTFWEAHQENRKLSQEQLVTIATEQIRQENELVLDADKFFFIDTDATTTYQFSQYYHGRALPKLSQLADDTVRRYDLFFLCDDDIPYEDTWDRSGLANRSIFQKRIRADLLLRGIPFITLRGSLNDRLSTVVNVLQRFQKWQSLPDALI